MLGGFGLALFSGAGEALLYDTLLSEKKEKLYSKYSGKGYLFSGVGLAASALAATFLVGYGLRTTIYATLIPLTIVTILPFFYSEPKRKKLSAVHIQKKSFELIKNNPIVKRVIIFFWVGFGVPVAAIMIFNQPMMQDYGLPLSMFGIVFLVMSAFAGLGSWLAHKLEKIEAYKTYLAMVITGILMLALVFNNSLYTFIFALTILYLLFGILTVLVPSHLNHATPSSHRATILSYGNMGRQVFIAVLIIVVGALRTNFNYSYVLVTTITLLFILLLLLLSWKKFLNKSL
jgi:MFS family permease